MKASDKLRVSLMMADETYREQGQRPAAERDVWLMLSFVLHLLKAITHVLIRLLQQRGE